MALHIQFAQPLTTPQGFTLTDLYARLAKVEYFRNHVVFERASDKIKYTGLANYGIEYFLSAAQAALPDAEPLVLPGLPRVVSDAGELVTVPSTREGMPDGQAHGGLDPAAFNQAGGYTRGYAFVSQALQAAFPDLTLSKA